MTPVKFNEDITRQYFWLHWQLTPLLSISMSRFLVAYSVGCAQGEGSCQCRFRSKPIREHLQKPTWNILRELPLLMDSFPNKVTILTDSFPNKVLESLLTPIDTLCDSIWYITSLTHWGRVKMATILLTTFSNAFSWMKMYEFCFRFHWSLSLKFQSTIFQHWFR